MTLPKIKSGEKAPEFLLKALNGAEVSLSLFHQQKIWLALYRYAGCPMCNMHFDDVFTRLGYLQSQNIVFIAVFESPEEKFPKKFREVGGRENLFVCPDPEQKMFHLYRLEASWRKLMNTDAFRERAKAFVQGYNEENIGRSLTTVPAHFLIENGVVHTAHYGRHVADHLLWKDIQAFGSQEISLPSSLKAG